MQIKKRRLNRNQEGRPDKKDSSLTADKLELFEKEWRRSQRQGQQLLSDVRVTHFLIENPVSASFLRREKGKLPYSVFKASADEIKFIKSVYKGRPPTAFFPHPTYVQSK
jgi:tubulin polyglutamylase TTLL4